MVLALSNLRRSYCVPCFGFERPALNITCRPVSLSYWARLTWPTQPCVSPGPTRLLRSWCAAHVEPPPFYLGHVRPCTFKWRTVWTSCDKTTVALHKWLVRSGKISDRVMEHGKWEFPPEYWPSLNFWVWDSTARVWPSADKWMGKGDNILERITIKTHFSRLKPKGSLTETWFMSTVKIRCLP